MSLADPPAREWRWPASPSLQSVVWQALGSAATLGTALWVSWHLGLAAQGDFGLAKSWFDAAAVAGAVGLPQGLLHLQYRLKVPAAAIWPSLARGLAGTAVFSAAPGVALWLLGKDLAAAVMLALPLGIAHLLARSILLAQRGVVVFGVVTALPAFAVGAAVVGWGITGHTHHFEWPLLAATLLAGTISWAMARRAAAGSAPLPANAGWSRRELWRVSLQSWLQAALGALMAVGLLNTVAMLGDSPAEVGAASLGLHLYQLFAVLAGYLAPLLFDRLARRERPTLAGWPASARWGAAALLGLALIGGVASRFDQRHAAWLLPLSLMLPAGLAAVAARVAGTVLLARSAYLELSLQAAARLAIALTVTALALRALPAAAAMALALLVTELATWWRSSWLLRSAA